MFYNDEEKNKIAWQEYTSYKIGDKASMVSRERCLDMFLIFLAALLEMI